MKVKMHYQRGINLIELSITIVVMGLILAVTWQMMPRLQSLPLFKIELSKRRHFDRASTASIRGFYLSQWTLTLS